MKISDSQLLSRDEFRAAVFARDNHKCVLCGAAAVDAHHIIERRLWPDGGYYLSNGASVCASCHLRCEETEIPVEQVRAACGITRILVPPHLYPDQPIDKWGNPILPNGLRLKGELFDDPSVQKVLRLFLRLFREYVKYPRTYHLPWSQSITNDDRVIPDELLIALLDTHIVVTEKMDGENTSVYSDYIHARSVDMKPHASRTWVKNFWAQRQHDIPKGWRVCGENLYAKHSIKYDNLPSYFMGFSIWDDRNMCLSWRETLEWFELLDVVPVPVIYQGPFDDKKIQRIAERDSWDDQEGYVVRSAREFHYSKFREHVAKFVRPNHVQTTKHWMHGQPIEQNELVK